MIDLKELRRRAEGKPSAQGSYGPTFASPGEVIDLLDMLEAAQADAARIDWLERSSEHHGFCSTGYGEYRHYAFQQAGYATVKQIIDAAMSSKD